MSVLFRVQQNTPDVYYGESRDFQLLGRLYDCIINGVKYDTDTIEYLVDTRNCKSNILPLLQTKLGFFTDNTYEDDPIRYVLRAFPMMIKNKGSLLSIKQAINVFLKLSHTKAQVKVWYTAERTEVNGIWIDDHSLIFEISNSIKNYQLLLEVLKYLIPTGFGFLFYFYSDIDKSTLLELEDKAELLFISNNINSRVRGNEDEYEPSSIQDRLIGAVDTTYIAGNDSITPTTNGTYNAGDNSLFLGILPELPSQASEGQYCIVDEQAYYYDNNTWNEISFLGFYSSEPSPAHNYDIITKDDNDILKYYMYNNDSWTECTNAIYVLKEELKQNS